MGFAERPTWTESPEGERLGNCESIEAAMTSGSSPFQRVSFPLFSGFTQSVNSKL